MSDSPMPPGTSASNSTSTTISVSINNNNQHSFNPQTNSGNAISDLSVGLSNNGQNDNTDDNGSDFSELEEGEIIESDLRPQPQPHSPVSKPLPVHPPSSRRYRHPPPQTRPPLGTLPYPFPLDLEQSLGPSPFHPVLPHLSYR